MREILVMALFLVISCTQFLRSEETSDSSDARKAILESIDRFKENPSESRLREVEAAVDHARRKYLITDGQAKPLQSMIINFSKLVDKTKKSESAVETIEVAKLDGPAKGGPAVEVDGTLTIYFRGRDEDTYFVFGDDTLAELVAGTSIHAPDGVEFDYHVFPPSERDHSTTDYELGAEGTNIITSTGKAYEIRCIGTIRATEHSDAGENVVEVSFPNIASISEERLNTRYDARLKFSFHVWDSVEELTRATEAADAALEEERKREIQSITKTRFLWGFAAVVALAAAFLVGKYHDR